ncbi:MAG: triose-phosphate isomerase [Rickettsiales bacterium]|jgi:triosephosphate isomerase|nr:triose-phosphate isomerase [Rickettsiales bacterium]
MIIANWKMNGDKALCHKTAELVRDRDDLVICPPATLIDFARTQGLTVGAQDVSAFDNGAHTGEVSAIQMRDIGAAYAIIGHSEKRASGDTDEIVAQKLSRATAAGLIPILCISEISQIPDQLTKRPIDQQTIIAYEPVWAIGTGKTPTVAEIESVAAQIRARAPNAKILYGGSVSDINAGEILRAKNIDGVLVGGASLDIEKFKTILNAL